MPQGQASPTLQSGEQPSGGFVGQLQVVDISFLPFLYLLKLLVVFEIISSLLPSEATDFPKLFSDIRGRLCNESSVDLLLSVRSFSVKRCLGPVSVTESVIEFRWILI